MSNNIVFRILEKKCGMVADRATVTKQGAWIVAHGTISVPDPCYDVKHDVKVNAENKEIDVYLKVYKSKVICIKCLAKIVFELKLNSIHFRSSMNTSEAKLKIVCNIRGKDKILFENTINL